MLKRAFFIYFFCANICLSSEIHQKVALCLEFLRGKRDLALEKWLSLEELEKNVPEVNIDDYKTKVRTFFDNKSNWDGKNKNFDPEKFYELIDEAAIHKKRGSLLGLDRWLGDSIDKLPNKDKKGDLDDFINSSYELVEAVGLINDVISLEEKQTQQFRRVFIGFDNFTDSKAVKTADIFFEDVFQKNGDEIARRYSFKEVKTLGFKASKTSFVSLLKSSLEKADSSNLYWVPLTTAIYTPFDTHDIKHFPRFRDGASGLISNSLGQSRLSNKPFKEEPELVQRLSRNLKGKSVPLNFFGFQIHNIFGRGAIFYVSEDGFKTLNVTAERLFNRKIIQKNVFAIRIDGLKQPGFYYEEEVTKIIEDIKNSNQTSKVETNSANDAFLVWREVNSSEEFKRYQKTQEFTHAHEDPQVGDDHKFYYIKKIGKNIPTEWKGPFELASITSMIKKEGLKAVVDYDIVSEKEFDDRMKVFKNFRRDTISESLAPLDFRHWKEKYPELEAVLNDKLSERFKGK